MRKFDQINLDRARTGQEIADPLGLDVAGQHQVEIGMAEVPTDRDDLRTVVVAPIPILWMRMKPRPGRPEHPVDSAQRTGLDRHAGGLSRPDQPTRSALRMPFGLVEHAWVEDQPVGRDARQDRRDGREVVEVRMAHDDRLEPTNAGRP